MSSNINDVQPNTVVPADQLVVIEIATDGRPIDQTYSVISVDVSLVADAVAFASFNILDGSPEGGFAAANAPELLPGKTVEISIGYVGNLVKVFTGVIVTQSLSINQTQGDVLTIACESGIIAADKTKAAPVLTLTYGMDIIDLSTDLRRAPNNSLSVRGNISFQGSAIVVPGNNIRIQGLANNINGAHNVISVYHALSDGNWMTSVTFGED